MNAVLDLVRVLYEPKAVYNRLSERPRVLVPLLALIVLWIAIQVLLLPFARPIIENAMRTAMEQRGAPPDRMPNTSMILAISIVTQAIGFALIAAVGGLLLWMFTAISGADSKFGTLFSVSLYGTVPFILQSLVAVLVLMVRGSQNITSPADLQPALGLDLLAPASKGFMRVLLGGVNPFSIWGIWLTALGVSITSKTSMGAGWFAAIGKWAVILLIVAALASLQPGG
jgi:hypothetical protein